MSEIVNFYLNKESSAPYRLEEIWHFSEIELERIHNYIQWLFPTDDQKNKELGKPYLLQEEGKWRRKD